MGAEVALRSGSVQPGELGVCLAGLPMSELGSEV